MKAVKFVKSWDEARQIAIEWQHKASGENMSWAEVVAAEDYFLALAAKFKLKEEFKENGII